MNRSKSDSEWFQHLAHFSVFTSFCCLLFLSITIPGLYLRSIDEQTMLHERAMVFKEITNKLWTEKLKLQSTLFGSTITFFSRAKRQIYDGVCKGCGPLACPYGPPGPPGFSGSDGIPGEAGNQGTAGDDGMDVQLDAEPEMPCVVCPSGPTGPRGAQGERGRQGSAGTPGEKGPHGNMGMDGGPGLAGDAGEAGDKGPEGPTGQPGKTTVAGIGIKGPKGPPGPSGMMGPPGPGGRGSVHPGETGPPGASGPMGAAGRQGHPGNEGPYGPPGDAGMPASYCPSDCGVSQIVSNIMPSEKARMEILKKNDENKVDDNHYYGGPAGTGTSGYGRRRMMGLMTHPVSQPFRLPEEDNGGWAYAHEMRQMRDEAVFTPRHRLSYDNTPPKGYENLLKDRSFKAKLARKMMRRKMAMNKV
ncbi:unnamed protein product, partial [Mesorhabditis belari]|uniref:Uncharacterized protein n=1 Tax=Mesorhabditis belari TaxID=2138241 RepID=A0AAF3FPM9_9BILA